MNFLYYKPLAMFGSSVKYFHLGVWVHKFDKWRPFIVSPMNNETTPIIKLGFITIRWGISYETQPSPSNTKIWNFYRKNYPVK
jgi:hypothetical protein